MASSLRSIIDRTRNHLAEKRGRIVDAVRAYRRFVVGVIALLALLAFMAAAPIRALDAANQRVEHLRATKQQLTASVTELERERARLQDRGHIELLARRRFGLVRPGETAYVVVTPEDELRKDGGPPEGAGHRAWYRWLFDAVVDMLPS
ncbi:MAG TPA: septum formation initiator family protein [Euzebyales bacterium]